MRTHRRLLVLLALLALIAAVTLFGDQGKPEASAVVAAVAPRKTVSEHISTNSMTASSTTAVSSILPLRPRAPRQDKTADAFVFRDWTPPPPPPSPPPPPPPPQAPPVPFSFIAKQFDNGQWIVFLARQERTYMVRAGETIEATYQVDTIAPPLLTLTYLPLKQNQSLAIGPAE